MVQICDESDEHENVNQQPTYGYVWKWGIPPIIAI